MKIPIYQVDAFTDQLFGGNPAAVCPLDQWLDETVMQNIAKENNLAETAFFVKTGDKYELRWFTPKVEIDLCGHATLASAHVLFNHLGFSGDVISFYSPRSGELKVSRKDGLLILDFPASKPEPAEIPYRLAEVLDTSPVQAFKSRDLMILCDNEDEIVSMEPEFNDLKEELNKIGCLGLIVTAKGYKADFVSRFFAPPAGIDEDPVTGSAHTTLIPYWAEQLGKTRMRALQLSERSGELFCELSGDRVLIGGNAVTYMIGEISV